MRRLLACAAIAATVFATGQALGAETVSDLVRQSRGHVVEGKLDLARDALTKALAIDPNSRDALRERAQVYGTLKDYDAGLADLTRAITLYPADAALRAERGMFHAAIGKSELGLKDMDAAIAQAPTNTFYLQMRSEQREDAGDQSGALADIDAALKIRPNDVGLKARRMDLAKPLGASDASAAEDREALYTAQIAARPKEAGPYLMRGENRALSGDKAGALEDYTKAIAIRPFTGAYLLRGKLYSAMGQPEKAEADYTATVRTDPFNVSLLARAQFYGMQGKTDAWLADATAALSKIKQNDPEALAEVIYAALAKPDLDLALKTANAWVAARPADFEALRLRAIVQVRRGDLEAAIADMTKAVGAEADDDEFLDAALRLAALQDRKGDFKAAVDTLETARREAPKNEGVLAALCRVKARGGIALQSLLADCEAALPLSPNNPDNVDVLAFAQLRLGKNAEALATYDKALTLRPGEAKSLYGRAVAKGRLGDKEGMWQDATSAAKVSPAVADAFAKVGMGLTATIVMERPVALDFTGRAGPEWITPPKLAEFYPERALDVNREGQAKLICTVAAQGNLANCTLVSETPEGFGFGEAALKAAQSARLRPTTINGVAVDGRPIEFRSRFTLD